GDKVPEILLQGDPKKVEEWRHEQSLQRTRERRPDMLNED
ncbi:MAG: tRNA ((1)-) methyltransferase, partial [Sediminibacterium sp.]|nr:tRNA ((1)-) methyltransferase [Sediminibacterium sp.]